MKLLKNIAGGVIFVLIAAGSACSVKAQSSEKNIKKTLQAAEVKNMADSQNFVFVPETLLPLRGRQRHLTPDYQLRVTKDSVISYLPYFGRAYTAPIDPTNINFDFTSTKFDYSNYLTKRADGIFQ